METNTEAVTYHRPARKIRPGDIVWSRTGADRLVVEAHTINRPGHGKSGTTILEYHDGERDIFPGDYRVLIVEEA